MEQRLCLRAYSWGMVMQESITVVGHLATVGFGKNLAYNDSRIRVLLACVFLRAKLAKILSTYSPKGGVVMAWGGV